MIWEAKRLKLFKERIKLNWNYQRENISWKIFPKPDFIYYYYYYYYYYYDYYFFWGGGVSIVMTFLVSGGNGGGGGGEVRSWHVIFGTQTIHLSL